ncbi:MAG TPA: Crp/Fnr family transcriptional regulator [Abditibacteriaceae bacterium]|jgi:CRP/FNR family cyclic AMP-dependent transcriptional regulator
MTLSETVVFLQASPLFQGLQAEELAALAPLWHPRICPRRTALMTANDEGDLIYLLVSGSVKIFLERPDGDVVLGLRGAGELLGEISLVDAGARSATVETMEKSAVLWASRHEMMRAIDRTPRIMHNLARILSSRLRLATAQIQALSRLDVRARLARQLLALADDCGQKKPTGTLIPLRVTQNILAEMVGASRVSVNLTFLDWREKGILVDLPNHRIMICNRGALEAEL